MTPEKGTCLEKGSLRDTKLKIDGMGAKTSSILGKTRLYRVLFFLNKSQIIFVIIFVILHNPTSFIVHPWITCLS